MVALVTAFLALMLCVGVIVFFAHRRPIGTPVTWGEAMVAAIFVFAAMFIAYGMLPHQWLNYSDNELKWRADKFVKGPGNVITYLPFKVTKEKTRDIIAVIIYVIGLGGQIFLWSYWQNRGKSKPKALPTSAFGRPLLKPAKPSADETESAGRPETVPVGGS
jgi:predicted permease